MPERKNRTRRSMLWVCALAVMVLLAALPATAAWYATQSAAGGSAIETASFEVSVNTEPKTAPVPLEEDLTALRVKYEAVWGPVEVANTLVYDTTVVTVTADEENTASGYVIVTYQNQDYYSDFIAPGGRVTFTVPGGEVRGSDGEITVSGEDALGKPYSNEFVIKAGWGRPEGELKLKDLQDLQIALDKQTADLIARQKQAYLEALAAQLEEQAKQAAEEAARKAAEEAASQTGEPTVVFTGS